MGKQREVPPEDRVPFDIGILGRRIQTLSVLVGILTLVMALMTFCYQVRSNEMGPIWGKVDPRVSVGTKLKIGNSMWGCAFACDMDIANLGTRAFEVGKMEAYVALKGSTERRRKLLGWSGKPWYSGEYIPLGYFTVKPKGGWNGCVSFQEPRTQAQDTTLGNLSYRMFLELQDKYFSDSNKALSSNRLTYEISDKLYDEIRAASAENVSWMRPGSYRLLISIPRADRKAGFVYRGGFAFEMTESNLELLGNLQGRAYKFPSEAPGNWAMAYLATPQLEPLTKEETGLLVEEADASPWTR